MYCSKYGISGNIKRGSLIYHKKNWVYLTFYFTFTLFSIIVMYDLEILGLEL